MILPYLLYVRCYYINMKDDLVSVIIPVFNTGKSCLRLIKRLEASSYKNIEIICVDDGSSNDSYKIISEYAMNKNNFVIKRQKNAGPSAARNTGLKYAHGKWVCFIDSDDLVDKNFLEELVDASDDNALLVCTALLYNRLAQNTSCADFMKPIRDRKKHESIKEYVIYSMIHDGRLYGVINKLFRKDIIVKYNIRFNEKMNFAEDTKFVLDYIDAAIKYYPSDCKIKTIYKPLYIYNFGTETSTVSKSSLDWNNWKTSYKNMREWARDDLSFVMRLRLALIWCRWRLSHALAVARSTIAYEDKIMYSSRFELFIANALISIKQ